MSNYIPNYDKKRKILARREQDIRRLVERGASHEELVAAAEDVRQARIGYLKSLCANPPADFLRHRERRANCLVAIQSLQEMSIGEVLRKFRAARLE